MREHSIRADGRVGRDHVRQKLARRQEHRIWPDNAAAVEKYARPGGHMIAEDAAEGCSQRVEFDTIHRNANTAMIEPMDRGSRPRGKVDSFAEEALPQHDIIADCAVCKYNARRDVAADATVRPDRRAAADFRSENPRSHADEAWPLQMAERFDSSIRRNHNRPLCSVEDNARINVGRGIKGQPIDSAHDVGLNRIQATQLTIKK